jgi:hypothetical protein
LLNIFNFNANISSQKSIALPKVAIGGRVSSKTFPDQSQEKLEGGESFCTGESGLRIR